MSMNLCVMGTRQVQVVKTGRYSTQEIRFGLWQTPTTVTWEALQSVSPKQFYADWVKNTSKDEIVLDYEEDDYLHERDTVGSHTHNPGVEHLTYLEKWISMAEAEGYEVEFYEE